MRLTDLGALQHPADVDTFNGFYDAVIEPFEGSRPPHVSSPTQSCIAVMSEVDYMLLSVSEVQNILRHKHIVVTGMAMKPLNFDAKGLRELTNLSAKIPFQGAICCQPLIFLLISFKFRSIYRGQGW